MKLKVGCYYRTEMKYDDGYHIDKIINLDTIERVYCSKNHKCKDSLGRRNWCCKSLFSIGDKKARRKKLDEAMTKLLFGNIKQ